MVDLEVSFFSYINVFRNSTIDSNSRLNSGIKIQKNVQLVIYHTPLSFLSNCNENYNTKDLLMVMLDFYAGLG
jgi:hypothetical protein